MNEIDHWNKIYSTKSDNELGWFETDLSYSLDQINKVSLNGRFSNVFVAGAGRSKIIDHLLKARCRVIVNDISDVAISKMKLEYHNQDNIEYVIGDVSNTIIDYDDTIDLWFDRAVLHFILDDNKITNYFKNCERMIKPGGHAIFSEFAIDGAEKCAGLQLNRYSQNMFNSRLTGFNCIECRDSIYLNPFGQERKYINCLYQKNAQQGDAPEPASPAR